MLSGRGTRWGSAAQLVETRRLVFWGRTGFQGCTPARRPPVPVSQGALTRRTSPHGFQSSPMQGAEAASWDRPGRAGRAH